MLQLADQSFGCLPAGVPFGLVLRNGAGNFLLRAYFIISAKSQGRAGIERDLRQGPFELGFREPRPWRIEVLPLVRLLRLRVDAVRDELAADQLQFFAARERERTALNGRVLKIEGDQETWFASIADSHARAQYGAEAGKHPAR